MTVKYRFLIDYSGIATTSLIKLTVTPFRYLEMGRVTEYFPLGVFVDVRKGNIDMTGGLAVRRRYDSNYNCVFQDNKLHLRPYEELAEMSKQMLPAVEDWLFAQWAETRDNERPDNALSLALKRLNLS